MSDEIDTSASERIWAGKNLTFTRYMVPSGKGVAEHPQGMLYLRADVDPLLDKLEAERDALRSIIRALLDCPHIADRDTYPWHEPETEAAVRRAYEALPDEGGEE